MQYCKEHQAPILIGANGEEICAVEWVMTWLEDVRVIDLIPEDQDEEQGLSLVLSNQATLPVDRVSCQVDGALQQRMNETRLLFDDLVGTTAVDGMFVQPLPTSDGLGMTPAAYTLTFVRSPDMPEEDPFYRPMMVTVDAGVIHALITD